MITLLTIALCLGAAYVVVMIGLYEAVDDDLLADEMVRNFWKKVVDKWYA